MPTESTKKSQSVPRPIWMRSLRSSVRFGPGPRTYGHNGSGGSLGIVDPDAGVSLGYVMNRLWWGPDRTDPRWPSIFDALYESL